MFTKLDLDCLLDLSSARGNFWDGLHGQHGVGHVNENGEALSSWCAQNDLTDEYHVQKKRIHQYTWQHPGSKKWQYIDYILMR